MDKRTAITHFAGLLAQAATFAAAARHDIKREDRIDAIDSIDAAIRKLTQARTEIAATLPEELRS